MSNDKVLLQIICLAIDESYDCIVSRQIRIDALRDGVLSIAEESLGTDYRKSEKHVLYGEEGMILNGESTVESYGIDSGDILYII